MSRYAWLIAFIVLAVSSVSFALPPRAFADGQAMVLPVDPAPLVAETSGGNRSFRIEVADDPRERERGLMFREPLEDDRGMLFVFEQTGEVGFWMKNTPSPLDLVFIGDDGRVRAVLPGKPFSEAVITPGVPVRFVLEVKAGIAEKAGIGAGDRIRHPAVDKIAGH